MNKKIIIKWGYLIIGPAVSLIIFLVIYFLNPFNFDNEKPLAALPAFLFSIVILLLNHFINTSREIRKTNKYSDKIYEAIKDYLHVTKIGSTERAMDYIISRLPALREVQNTSFNLGYQQERADEKFYDTDCYLELMNQIALSSTKKLIWKDIGDHSAIERFRLINKSALYFSKRKKHLYKYKLINSNPQMNFIILEFIDGNREVLFNWDYTNIGHDPIVLVSRDHFIVDMYSVHFAVLWKNGSNDHDNSATKSTSIK